MGMTEEEEPVATRFLAQEDGWMEIPLVERKGKSFGS